MARNIVTIAVILIVLLLFPIACGSTTTPLSLNPTENIGAIQTRAVQDVIGQLTASALKPTATSVAVQTPGLSPTPIPTTLAPPAPTDTPAPTSLPPDTSTPAVGTVTGHVTIGVGAGQAVPGAQIQLIDLPGLGTTSGPDGSYTLPEVPPGHHTIVARSSCCASGQLDVFVRANETSTQDLRMFIFLQGTPTPTSTPRLQLPRPTQGPLAPRSSTGNWSGSWSLNFGTMNLNQSGANVSGVYHNAFNQADGTVQGTLSDNVLNGTWSNGDRSGSIHWVLNPDGNTINGDFNGSSPWCGARSGKPFPTGCSFAGAWTSNVAGNQNCPMKLTQIDTTVNGTYCNGSVSGTLSYTGHSNETILNGTWITTGSGSFQLYLLGYNALQFQGHWNQNNPWCGWRSNAVMPSPCLR